MAGHLFFKEMTKSQEKKAFPGGLLQKGLSVSFNRCDGFVYLKRGSMKYRVTRRGQVQIAAKNGAWVSCDWWRWKNALSQKA